MTIWGIDTSNHDVLDRNGGANLDWAKIRANGVDFAWHKVSDGLHFYRDPTAAAALAGMRANLPVWGGYHVLWGNRSITGQLDWHFAILDEIAAGWRDDPRYVVVMDCEPFSYCPAPSIDQVNEAGDYILSNVRKREGGYCPPWVYGSALDRLRYPLISSNYGPNAAGYISALYPGDTSPRWQATANRQADVLQTGSRFTVSPYQTMDGDVFRGSVDQLIALFGGTPPPAPATLPTSRGDSMIQVADTHGNIVLTDWVSWHHRLDYFADLKPMHEDGMLRVTVTDAQMARILALPQPGQPEMITVRVAAIGKAVDGLQAGGTPSDVQVESAHLKALQNAGVQDGIGRAVASHLHLTAS